MAFSFAQTADVELIGMLAEMARLRDSQRRELIELMEEFERPAGTFMSGVEATKPSEIASLLAAAFEESCLSRLRLLR